ncbi:hypothetical protein LINPERHAP2_LOCUS9820 [Linum perenne]
MKVTWSDSESEDEEQAYMAHTSHEESTEDSSSENEVSDSILSDMTKDDIISAFVDLSDYMLNIKAKYKQVRKKLHDTKKESMELATKLEIINQNISLELDQNRRLHIKNNSLKKQIGILEERLYYSNLRKRDDMYKKPIHLVSNRSIYQTKPRIYRYKEVNYQCYFCQSHEHTANDCTFNYISKRKAPKKIWVPKSLTTCHCAEKPTAEQ